MISIHIYSFETGKPVIKQNLKVRLERATDYDFSSVRKILLPKTFALTMLGDAAGGRTFSFRNGSTLFGSDQIGYPLIFPYNIIKSLSITSHTRRTKASWNGT